MLFLYIYCNLLLRLQASPSLISPPPHHLGCPEVTTSHLLVLFHHHLHLDPRGFSHDLHLKIYPSKTLKFYTFFNPFFFAVYILFPSKWTLLIEFQSICLKNVLSLPSSLLSLLWYIASSISGKWSTAFLTLSMHHVSTGLLFFLKILNIIAHHIIVIITGYYSALWPQRPCVWVITSSTGSSLNSKYCAHFLCSLSGLTCISLSCLFCSQPKVTTVSQGTSCGRPGPLFSWTLRAITAALLSLNFIAPTFDGFMTDILDVPLPFFVAWCYLTSLTCTAQGFYFS